MSDRLYVMVVSGTREKLQMAAMVVAVAAASGTEVIVFISMNALSYFLPGGSRTAPAEGDMGRLLSEKKAPEFLDLFHQAVGLGSAKLHPCSMAIDILGADEKTLGPTLQKPMGLTRFLSEAEGSQILTF